MSKAVVLSSSKNTRDIGGVPALENKKIRVRALIRSDAPVNITSNDIVELQKIGISKVVDLRSTRQVEKNSAFSQIKTFDYYNFPIIEGEVIPQKIDDVVENYWAILNNKNLFDILEVIANNEKGTIIHCTLGKDRTGVIIAFALLHCGVSESDIIADYMLTATCMEYEINRLCNKHPEIDKAVIIPRESFIKGLFEKFYSMYESTDDFFEKHGRISLGEKIKKRLIETN